MKLATHWAAAVIFVSKQNILTLYKLKIEKISNLILQDMEQQTVQHYSTAYKLSCEWSHTRVLSTYVKVRNNN